MHDLDPARFSLDPHDPESVELFEVFAGALGDRVDGLRDAFERGDARALRRIAHQLKGAAPGFGCTGVGDAARALESAVDESDAEALGDIRARLDALVEECRLCMELL